MPFEEAARLVALCTERGVTLATAESCTAGLIAATITDIPGSSAVFDRGFVTYSNLAKQQMLEVPEALIAKHGAVSEPVVNAMAYGALTHSEADLSVAVSGIAGPGGGTPEKPVGLVFISVAARFGKPMCEEHFFHGNRENVRLAAVEKALSMLYDVALTL